MMRDNIFLELKLLCCLALPCLSHNGGVHGDLYNEHGYLDLLWPYLKPTARCCLSWERGDLSLHLWPHGIYIDYPNLFMTILVSLVRMAMKSQVQFISLFFSLGS